MSRRDWGDVAAAVFVLAIITLAVRPGSLAPAFVEALGSALVALVGFATGPESPGGGGSVST